MDLSNKVAVVTGASRGLGAGIAEEMATHGLRLGLCARAVPAIPAASQSTQVLVRSVDVTDEKALDLFATEVVNTLGPIDLWINNAGILEPVNALRKVRSQDFKHHLDVNVLGVFHGSKIFANHVRSRDRSGVLINISSGAARSPYAGWSAYCAGKAAVDRMSECIDIEEDDSGLIIYSVAPGIIDTDMQELIRTMTADRFPLVEKFRNLKSEGAFTTADKVANAILDLAFNPSAARDRVSIDLRE